ncbi:MAG: hypothetical protein IPJ37_13530 [Bacteroidales bacterium]|nr:hypothetical protein [Bacteroidales bacterium]
MNSWGINTIGNWSDPNLGESHQKAYVATLDGWGIESGKMGMPDVYAPGYRAMVDSAAALQCRPKKDDPYLIGYFIGNELPGQEGRQSLPRLFLTEMKPYKEGFKGISSDGDTPEKRKKFAYDSYSEFIEIVSANKEI